MRDQVLKVAVVCLACVSIFNAGTGVVFADKCIDTSSQESSTKSIESRSVEASDAKNSRKKVIRLGSMMKKSDIDDSGNVATRKEKSPSMNQVMKDSKTVSDTDVLSRFNDCALYNKSIGSVELPSLGIKCDVIFGLSQKDVDAKNRMVLLPCCGVPGESGRSLVLMDHNYQTGDIILDSPYGTTLVLNSGDLKLEYTFENMARAYTDYTLKYIPRDIRTRVVSGSYQMGNDIVLYSDDTPILEKSWTKTEDGEQYLYFITCCSESEGLPGDKWVCRFKLQK